MEKDTYGMGNGIGTGRNFFFEMEVAAINAVAAALRPFFFKIISKASRLDRCLVSVGNVQLVEINIKENNNVSSLLVIVIFSKYFLFSKFFFREQTSVV